VERRTSDPAEGALPEHEYVSYLPYKDEATGDTALLKAGWNEYPLSADQVRLGNRTWMGRQVDKVFEGYRTWRITDHQVSQAHRMLAGTYDGLTPNQIDEFISRVYRLSTSNGRRSAGAPAGRSSKARWRCR